MERRTGLMWSPVNPRREQLPIGETVPEDLLDSFRTHDVIASLAS